ncbi:MAG: hypothetical protein QME94_17560 [Anaerolineae bacterium]|nr:hypothetical protein [Anaerolineae bacterium]
MGMAFRVLWAALKDYYEEMFTLVGANLVWVAAAAVSLGGPAAAGRFLSPAAGLGMGLFLGFLILPPITAGMLYLTNQVAHHKSIEFGMLWEGAKTYAVKSWLLTLINLVAAVLIATNFWFYGQFEAQWAVIVRGLFVGVGVLWCLIQVYVFPMLLEQQEPRLLLALRNAAFLTFASPITTLVLAVLMIVLAALSIGLTLPFAVAMVAVLALMANEAVLALLIHFKIRKPPEDDAA